ncbi:hypothetical protein EK599_21575 [Vibrio sp. T187]|uniref:hypothetical protein n=1 Tax=Vibrio TaxID=662 RepID=UPI0010C9C3E9|nr:MULTISPECIES: hypothetical protein [Vibrio]MBW3698268.1 hypothetical protein [Vibrio sp. T187]
MKKLVLLLVLFGCSAHAHHQDIQMENLPFVRVFESHFMVFSGIESKSVFVEKLDSSTIKKFNVILSKARRDVRLITDSGLCPNFRISNGPLGVISSEGGDSINFEVVCTDDTVQLYLSLRDQYVRKYKLYKLPVESFEHWVNAIEVVMESRETS